MSKVNTRSLAITKLNRDVMDKVVFITLSWKSASWLYPAGAWGESHSTSHSVKRRGRQTTQKDDLTHITMKPANSNCHSHWHKNWNKSINFISLNITFSLPLGIKYDRKNLFFIGNNYYKGKPFLPFIQCNIGKENAFFGLRIRVKYVGLHLWRTCPCIDILEDRVHPFAYVLDT